VKLVSHVMKYRSYETPYYAVFSCPLSYAHSCGQISRAITQASSETTLQSQDRVPSSIDMKLLFAGLRSVPELKGANLMWM
jgi:hypothetical protein